jgi:bifunctional ADP-heptose synthase (sugar kinase/adenylyltransferase)
LRHAGAEVEFSTVLGQDGLGAWVAEELGQDGIDHHITDDQSRPTTHKNAFVCSDYRLLKVETVANRSISEKQLDYFRADSGHVAA